MKILILYIRASGEPSPWEENGGKLLCEKFQLSLNYEACKLDCELVRQLQNSIVVKTIAVQCCVCEYVRELL